MNERLPFDRDRLLEYGFDPSIRWDVIVIGGGATGLGAAVDAAGRGYKTLLVEQHDFGKGTSSRSTKLVHGGVRYLRQGNVSLVVEGLKERGRLLQNAPHLVRTIPFVIPCYKWWERPFYGAGLKLYEAMSGRWKLGSSAVLSPEETLGSLGNIPTAGLRGGVRYFDGQFDDARMIINLAQTCADLGGVPLNYVRATRLVHRCDKISGVVVTDVEGNTEIELAARAVINATGVFADAVRRLDDSNAGDIIQPSQGVHIVLGRRFLPGTAALMIPSTDDGRVLFAIPWHGHVIFGTTDTQVDSVSLEPTPLETEVDFLLGHAARHLTCAPTRADVLSVYAGLRPLVRPAKSEDTKAIARDHVLRVSKSGLVTITGGKWTTYRRMAQIAVDNAARVADLDVVPSRTQSMRIHGSTNDVGRSPTLAQYGSDGPAVQDIMDEVEDGDKPIHPDLPYLRGEIVWSVRNEMARTVEDVLARRTRSLFLDARASIEAASVVSTLVANELGRDEDWVREQVTAFRTVAKKYVPRVGANPAAHATKPGRARCGHYDIA